MLGVRRKVVRRATTAVVAVALVSLPTTAEARPAGPTQEQDQASEDRSPIERAMVGVETLSASGVTTNLIELHAEINRQLEALQKTTDRFVAEVDRLGSVKEQEVLEV